jgi:hypothetical protein
MVSAEGAYQLAGGSWQQAVPPLTPTLSPQRVEREIKE